MAFIESRFLQTSTSHIEKENLNTLPDGCYKASLTLLHYNFPRGLTCLRYTLDIFTFCLFHTICNSTGCFTHCTDRSVALNFRECFTFQWHLTLSRIFMYFELFVYFLFISLFCCMLLCAHF